MEAPDGVTHVDARVAQHVFDLQPIGAVGFAGGLATFISAQTIQQAMDTGVEIGRQRR